MVGMGYSAVAVHAAVPAVAVAFVSAAMESPQHC